MIEVSSFVGGRVRYQRTVHGLSQAELAQSMRALHHRWRRDTVAALETGRRRLSVDEFASLLWILDLDADQLLPTLSDLCPTSA